MNAIRVVLRNWLLILMAIGAALGAMLLAEPPKAAADGVRCQTVLWGFLGSQRRELCDGPINGDGGWLRTRTIYTPAHTTPINCYGRYYVTCYGGDFVGLRINSTETYPVFPGTVLPDEPAHIG